MAASATPAGHAPAPAAVPAAPSGKARRAGRKDRESAQKLPWERTWIFWLEVFYLLGLGTLAVLYFTDVLHVRHAVGPVPVAVPWFGALGGVMISLTGVFDHPYDWDSGQRLWHVSRPLLGAAVGVVAVLMVKAGILAAGITPTPPKADGAPGKAGTPGSLDNLFFYLVAFGVGYREETFRALMKRLLDVILSPGTSTAAPEIDRLAPDTGPADGGTAITILGSGLTGIQSVNFGDKQVRFEAHGTGAISVESPKAEAAGLVPVTVKTSAGQTAVSQFTYT